MQYYNISFKTVFIGYLAFLVPVSFSCSYTYENGMIKTNVALSNKVSFIHIVYDKMSFSCYIIYIVNSCHDTLWAKLPRGWAWAGVGRRHVSKGVV